MSGTQTDEAEHIRVNDPFGPSSFMGGVRAAQEVMAPGQSGPIATPVGGSAADNAVGQIITAQRVPIKRRRAEIYAEIKAENERAAASSAATTGAARLLQQSLKKPDPSL